MWWLCCRRSHFRVELLEGRAVRAAVAELLAAGQDPVATEPGETRINLGPLLRQSRPFQSLQLGQ